jgi:hypothetical protein
MHDDDGAPNAPLHVLLSPKEIAAQLSLSILLERYCKLKYLCSIYLDVSITHACCAYFYLPFRAPCGWPHAIMHCSC